jgi:hypothetical protein
MVPGKSILRTLRDSGTGKTHNRDEQEGSEMTSPDTNPRIKEAMDTLIKMFDEENLEKAARAVVGSLAFGPVCKTILFLLPIHNGFL